MRTESGNQEIFDKLVYVSRCVKVVKGGRKFSFSAIVVSGDGKGKIGIGLGKAAEVMDAREKAVHLARKQMIRIPLRDGRTLHHDITASYCSGKVIMRSAPSGTGVIAGGAVRSLLEVLGIQDVVVKSVGTSNPHNMLKAAMKGLKQIKSPRYIAQKRGKKVGEIVGKREHGLKVTIKSDAAPLDGFDTSEITTE
ncbi:30S ribosomal protein S5 [Rickettsiales endosymbiont of Peranema trichophorum]|uniref:30S ribosomal protein S5 n=1 Tax=Rickettsiales endosymbiont of Peranema trichophorum TaxID=2486577 RepID=UPI001023E499|nr:30S ribosomal protein S5 [Rickettsiales endosymbiont of Peranema trichophorum]RZI45575.1 30S ribosomal protein S5 [Rickettsiales endosymbiont of Peranema trichophorum]